MDKNKRPKDKEPIHLELTKSEAIVLFELLSRINNVKQTDLFEDQSEERILWDLECLLEKQLAEPFRKDYFEILQKAREEVKDSIE